MANKSFSVSEKARWSDAVAPGAAILNFMFSFRKYCLRSNTCPIPWCFNCWWWQNEDLPRIYLIKMFGFRLNVVQINEQRIQGTDVKSINRFKVSFFAWPLNILSHLPQTARYAYSFEFSQMTRIRYKKCIRFLLWLPRKTIQVGGGGVNGAGTVRRSPAVAQAATRERVTNYLGRGFCNNSHTF